MPVEDPDLMATAKEYSAMKCCLNAAMEGVKKAQEQLQSVSQFYYQLQALVNKEDQDKKKVRNARDQSTQRRSVTVS